MNSKKGKFKDYTYYRRALCSFRLAHTMEADILKTREPWDLGKTLVVPNIIT